MSLRDRYPLRPCWLVFWAALICIGGLAYIYIAASDDWSAALTNQTMALVARYWWVGMLVLAATLWLVWHFATRVLPIWWRQWRSRKEDSDGS